MSWLADSSELVSGGWLSSAYAGHGILGSAIPTTGDNGGSPVLNDGISSTKEYRWELVTGPGAGTLTLYEDLTFEFSHTSDVLTSFVYRLYEDGVSAGTATVSLQIGPSRVVISATTENAVGSVSSRNAASCTINATTGQVVGSVSSASGVANVLVHAITQNVVGAIGATGYVPTGLTLTNDDINAIANAVWAHSSASSIAVRMAEVWGRLGLDPSKPLLQNKVEITFGDVVMAMTSHGNEVTVTRQ